MAYKTRDSRVSALVRILNPAIPGSLQTKSVEEPGLLRPAAVYEIAQQGDSRKWMCVMEVSGVILRADIAVSAEDAMREGGRPSFWAKKWADAFKTMHDHALAIEKAVADGRDPGSLLIAEGDTVTSTEKLANNSVTRMFPGIMMSAGWKAAL